MLPQQDPNTIQYQDDMEELDEGEIDKVYSQQKTAFYFVVDRSGSMGGSRIETAKEALKLFM